MQTVLFGEFTPLSFRERPPGTILLVFECIPKQYQRVHKWITEHWDQVTPLYRVRIPCAHGHDPPFDLSTYCLRHKTLQAFTGRFECWPESFTYDVVPLTVHSITEPQPWPFESHDRLSDIYHNAVGCLPMLLYPNARTGISMAQQRVLQKVKEGQRVTRAIVEATAYEMLLDPAQVDVAALTKGNWPLLEIRGHTIHPLRDDLDLESIPVPLYLMNGPYPLAKQTLVELFMMYIHGDERWSARMDAAPPFCPPYRFHCKMAKGYVAESGRIILPWGAPHTEAEVAVSTPYHQYGELKGAAEVTVNGQWLFWSDTGAVEFTRASEYAAYWVDLYLTYLIEERQGPRAFREVRNRFLRSLSVGETFTVQFEEQGRQETRLKFRGEDEAGARRRVAREYGPQYVDAFMNLPFSLLTLNTGWFDDEPVVFDWHAKEAWRVQLQAV